MELVNLPKSGVTEKRYRHFSVNSFADRQYLTDKKKEFFYIGSDSFVIDSLVKLFESGYAAEKVEQAISILSKVVTKRSVYPDMILVDSRIGHVSLQVFRQFLSSSPVLKNIPLLVDGSYASEKELDEIRKLAFVDEIINMHEQSEKLLSKLFFIRKIKDIANESSLENKIGWSRPTGFGIQEFLKRGFDIVCASVILALLSPIFLLIAVAIWLESKGPIFYISKRAGKGYKIFNFYKFRTMELGADKMVDQLSHLNQYDTNKEASPLFFKVSNDPRITKVGAFLRNTSLDELPQLFNVMAGHMSLVGNRPLPLYEAETLTTDDWAERFMAPAGITGLWQIKKRGQDDMSAEERIGLDIAYANKNNFMYDLWIVANTPTALLQKSSV